VTTRADIGEDAPPFAVNSIVTGDCMDALSRVPDGAAQLVIADPPYNLGPRFAGSREWRHDPEWDEWCAGWLAECRRVLAEDGNLFVYGIHHYLCYAQVRLYEMGMHYRRQIIWHYENGFSSARRTLATHYEPILWFSKSQGYYFREIREPYKSQERLRHKIIKNGKVWTPHPDGRMAGDVWTFPVLAGKRFAAEKEQHPAQKPLALTHRLVEHFSEAGRLVVVPFVGSGTEVVSAAMHGRDFWGCEINPGYVAIAERRLAEVRRTRDVPEVT